MKFIYLITYASMFFVLSGCGGGGSSSNNSSNNNSTTQTVLEGTWKTTCYQADNGYEISTNTFTNGDIEGPTEVYSDSSCQTNTVTISVKGTFSIGESNVLGTGETVNDLNITFISATMTPKTSVMVDFYNSEPVFQCNGTKSYTLNQETDVSDCSFITDNVTIGSMQYAIFFIDTNKLYSSDFADSNAQRPTAIDYSPNNIFTK